MKSWLRCLSSLQSRRTHTCAGPPRDNNLGGQHHKRRQLRDTSAASPPRSQTLVPPWLRLNLPGVTRVKSYEVHAVAELSSAALVHLGLRALSLFSGGGGLDLGFDRAGYEHVASYEILEPAAATLVKAKLEWTVLGGADGDVRQVDWSTYRGEVDVVHGGPPGQPFSMAGRQRGALDDRNMWPEFVKAVAQIKPAAFVAENVPALATAKFAKYVRESIVAPMQRDYHLQQIVLRAQDFGVPSDTGMRTTG